jgi:hypothetical protein
LPEVLSYCFVDRTRPEPPPAHSVPRESQPPPTRFVPYCPVCLSRSVSAAGFSNCPSAGISKTTAPARHPTRPFSCISWTIPQPLPHACNHPIPPLPCIPFLPWFTPVDCRVSLRRNEPPALPNFFRRAEGVNPPRPLYLSRRPRLWIFTSRVFISAGSRRTARPTFPTPTQPFPCVSCISWIIPHFSPHEFTAQTPPTKSSKIAPDFRDGRHPRLPPSPRRTTTPSRCHGDIYYFGEL